jgi:hypothetical protein
MILTTKFNLDQQVYIIELERSGIIKSIWVTVHGTEYQVRYFDDGEARTIYFYETELKEL